MTRQDTPASPPLLELLDRLAVPAAYSNEKQQLVDAIESSTAAGSGPVDRVAELLNRILARNTAAPQPALALARDERLAEFATALLHHIDVGDESAHAIGELMVRLDRGVGDDEWPGILADLARLTDQAIGSLDGKNRDLESFLRELCRQLGDVQREIAPPDLPATGDHGQTDTVRLATIARRDADLRQRLDEMRHQAEALRQELHQRRQRLLTDPLTGIPSRFAYHERLKAEFTTWQRYRRPLGYVLFDIDHFKAVNQRYGHRAGDRLLRLVAGTLAENLRQSDFIARLGGEEFVLLLPETGADDALRLADKLRLAVTAGEFTHHGEQVSITLSAGVTQFRSSDSLEAVYERADRALYRAKQEGCDRSIAE